MSTLATIFRVRKFVGTDTATATQLLQLSAIIVQQIMATVVIVAAAAVVYGISCVNLCPIYEIFTNFSAIIVVAQISHTHSLPLIAPYRNGTKIKYFVNHFSAQFSWGSVRLDSLRLGYL